MLVGPFVSTLGCRHAHAAPTDCLWLAHCRLQARQLEQQLFQQRLACSTLEISLRAYNSCLGETEQELAEAAAEIQVGSYWAALEASLLGQCAYAWRQA